MDTSCHGLLNRTMATSCQGILLNELVRKAEIQKSTVANINVPDVLVNAMRAKKELNARCLH